MRIGTWNLEAKWGDGHRSILESLGCHVLLLTEVPDRVQLDGYVAHFGTGASSPGSRWAAVLSRSALVPLPDPHPASAAALVAGVRFCSSVLPWPLSGEHPAFPGSVHQQRFEESLTSVVDSFAEEATVWGGDWNQPITGRMSGFSHAGRRALLAATEHAGLQLPLAGESGRMPTQGTIDQVAVPRTWRVEGTGRVPVPAELSDHDAYWVDSRPS